LDPAASPPKRARSEVRPGPQSDPTRWIIHVVPREPIARDEIERALGRALRVLPEGSVVEIFKLLESRRYAPARGRLRSLAELSDDRVAADRAMRVLEHFALLKAESDLGGRFIQPRWSREPMPWLVPHPFESLTSELDGYTPIEHALRRTKVDRLAGLSLLLDLARRGHLVLQRPASSSLVPVAESAARPLVPSLAAGRTPLPPPAPTRRSSRSPEGWHLLIVDTDPPGAHLWIDDVAAGVSPIELCVPLDHRRHIVRVHRDGYCLRDATYVADGDVRLIVALQAAPP
jgi:hypothetical protein